MEKKRQKGSKGILTFKHKKAYKGELALEQERVRRKETWQSFKESEAREAITKGGYGPDLRIRSRYDNLEVSNS